MSEKKFSGRRFLLVDDEPDLIEVIRDLMEDDGATVDQAISGNAAFPLTHQTKFDAVISDIRMADGDGFTLAKKLKAQEGPLPIVFLVTGFADLQPSEGFDCGIEAIFQKPFKIATLIKKLAETLTEPEKRWAVPFEGAGAKQMPMAGGLQDLISSGQIFLGRGGIFFRGSPAGIKAADLVNLDFKDSSVVKGIVRWVENSPEPNYSQGIGIEFLNLNAKAIQFVLAENMRQRPQAYIPRK